MAITNRMQTMVIGGTPELRMVFELTKESPQNRTVPQTASVGRVRLFTGGTTGCGMMKAHATRNPWLSQRGGAPQEESAWGGRRDRAERGLAIPA